MKLNIPLLSFIFCTHFLITTVGHSQSLFTCEESFYNNRHLPNSIRFQLPELAATQAIKLEIDGKKVLIQNKEIAEFISIMGTGSQELPDLDQLYSLIVKLIREGTFEIPVDEDGFLAAANNGDHGGGYGQHTWARDIARAFQGIIALPELRTNAFFSGGTTSSINIQDDLDNEERMGQSVIENMGQAMLGLITEPEQFDRVLRNIFDPNFFKNGHANTLLIRWNIEGRRQNENGLPSDEVIEAELAWGHKQNDAIALYGHSLLDSIASGALRPDSITEEARAQLLFLTAFFQRIQYYEREDVGAWEELMGVRTSSIGLVTSFLERMKKGFLEGGPSNPLELEFFEQLKFDFNSGRLNSFLAGFMHSRRREFSLSTDQAVQFIRESFELLDESIENAYQGILPALGITRNEDGTTTYGRLREVTGNNHRDEDAALLHLLLYPPSKLSVSDQLHILNEIERVLLREAGIVRYKDDWFLYGNPYMIGHSGNFPFSPDHIAVMEGENYINSNKERRDGIYTEYWRQERVKDMTNTLRYVGTDLEAQWSFQDAMMAQIRVRLFTETKDQVHLQKAWFHIVRSLGAITGEGQLNIEGHEVTPFRAPEAWVPVRMISEGQLFKAYFASPNSPLNWTIAENITALYLFTEALKVERQ